MNKIKNTSQRLEETDARTTVNPYKPYLLINEYERKQRNNEGNTSMVTILEAFFGVSA